MGGDAVVAAEVLGDCRISQDDDIGGGPLARRRPRPILQVTGPGQAGEDRGVFFRLADQEIFQGLQVGGRGAQTGQIDQSLEGFQGHRRLLMEAAIAAVSLNEFFDHGDLLNW